MGKLWEFWGRVSAVPAAMAQTQYVRKHMKTLCQYAYRQISISSHTCACHINCVSARFRAHAHSLAPPPLFHPKMSTRDTNFS